MAHTPGPWRLHPHSGTIIVNGSTVYSVKDLTTENEAGLAGDANMDDKRLMAASPELLAALKKHIPWQRNGEPDRPPQGWGIWQDAVDAINKAEGRV